LLHWVAPEGAFGDICMSSYISLFFHIVWSTKGRQPYFSSAGRKRLHNYIKVIIQRRQLRVELIAIGGMEDHIHLLVRMRSAGDIAPIVRYVKSVSSKFVSMNRKGDVLFAWQRKYGVFSVSASHVSRVRHYICHQEEHHERFGYEKELEFLAQL